MFNWINSFSCSQEAISSTLSLAEVEDIYIPNYMYNQGSFIMHLLDQDIELHKKRKLYIKNEHMHMKTEIKKTAEAYEVLKNSASSS
jgi:hypothetical protein